MLRKKLSRSERRALLALMSGSQAWSEGIEKLVKRKLARQSGMTITDSGSWKIYSLTERGVAVANQINFRLPKMPRLGPF
jgi:hypothetical protein